MKAADPQKQQEATVILTTGHEVISHVASMLREAADEFKSHACDSVTAGRRGDKYVLSGKVGYHQSTSFSDVYQQRVREGFFVLGHAALGPQTSMRTVASLRSEITKSLKRSLATDIVFEEVGTRFTITFPDGHVVISSKADRGSSLIQYTSHLPVQTLRA